MTQGVVGKIFEKDFGQGPTFSFKLRGDETFYRLGKRRPSFAEGDSVRFESSVKGTNTYANNVVPWKEDGTINSASVSSVAKASSGPRTSDEFWRNKELRDVATQQRIELQSCRNSAIELVRLLLQPGVEAAKLPAAQAKREAIVAEMVRKYTADFLQENKSGGPKSDDPVPDAAEEAALATTEGGAVIDGDDWN